MFKRDSRHNDKGERTLLRDSGDKYIFHFTALWVQFHVSNGLRFYLSK